MSTYVPRMPNLVVPATQNTAPVLEFRCLYTHDLRQKKKRWQDGLLRFHTFNKRVMVYDVPRNFIGDTHWREGEVVQDGDELQLEKGILIQVGEAVGSMQQDLTALLERRKLAQDGPTTYDVSPRTTYTSTARTTGAPLTQLRPKSLNALLGTSRGAYGRATLPSKSPYQERCADDRQRHDESHRAKKRKVEGHIGLRYGIQTAIQNNIDQGLSSGRTTTPLSSAPPLQKKLNTEVICVESDDENMKPTTWQRKKARVSSKRKLWDSGLDPSSLPSANYVSTSNNTKQGLSSIFAISEAENRSGFGCRPPPTRVVLPNLTEQRLVNPLRFASTKPRKKLMYKDHLSRHSHFEPLPESGDKITSLGQYSVTRTARNRTLVELTDDLGELHEAQQEHVGIALGFHRKPESSERIEISQSFDNSTLDASKICDRDSRNLKPCNISVKGKEPVSGVGVEIEEAVSPTAVAAELEALSEIRGHGFINSNTYSLSAVGMNEDMEDSGLSQMDQLLLSRQKVWNTTPKPCISPTAVEKELVTVECQTEACKQLPHIPYSKRLEEEIPIVTTSLHPQGTLPDLEVHEKQLHLYASLPQPTRPTMPVLPALTKHPCVPSRQRSHLKKSFSETHKTLLATRTPARTPMKKSVSDMTGVHISFHNGQVEKVPIENKDLDLGPWSREAFDLFG